MSDRLWRDLAPDVYFHPFPPPTPSLVNDGSYWPAHLLCFRPPVPTKCQSGTTEWHQVCSHFAPTLMTATTWAEWFVLHAGYCGDDHVNKRVIGIPLESCLTHFLEKCLHLTAIPYPYPAGSSSDPQIAHIATRVGRTICPDFPLFLLSYVDGITSISSQCLRLWNWRCSRLEVSFVFLKLFKSQVVFTWNWTNVSLCTQISSPYIPISEGWIRISWWEDAASSFSSSVSVSWNSNKTSDLYLPMETRFLSETDSVKIGDHLS